MEKAQTSHEKMGKTPAKKKNNNNNAQSSQKCIKIYCILCRKNYMKHEAQQHMHGIPHHRELETVLGKDSFHECQACMASSMGLNAYAQHISTAQHKVNLKSLMSKNVKPIPLSKTLSKETMSQIEERNKMLKKEGKKAVKKKKKKQKQKHANMVQEATRKNTGASNGAALEISRQMDKWRKMQQMLEAHQRGSNKTVFQNKENKVSILQRPPYKRESTVQNCSGKLLCLSEEPEGRIWHPLPVQDQFTQSTQQMKYDDNFSVKTESYQWDGLVRSTYNYQGGAADVPKQVAQPAISQNNYYTKTYNNATDTDFTSDQLPQNGAIFFDENDSTGSSQTEQEGSAQPTSANGARDVDVSSMIRQIRRALGVREPCRADRKARKQNSKESVRAGDRSVTTQQAGAEKEQTASGSCRHVASAADRSVQPSHLNSTAPASHSGVCPSSSAPAKPKQATVKPTQGMTQRCEKILLVASDSNGLINSTEGEPHGTVDGQALTSTEPNQHIVRRVRIAHKGPTGNKLLSLLGPKRKPSWRDMYNEMKRTKQERVRGMPRFGIVLANPRSDQESSTQAEDNDLPLSEGFHWESFPDSPSGAHWAGPPAATTTTRRSPPPHVPPPPRDTTVSDSRTETESRMQEPLEQPGAAQEICSSQPVKVISVKVEAELVDENGDLGGNSSASKRRHDTHGAISDNQPVGKKKKTKSNKDQDQMDQLLAVSLREEELSRSLQDLDQSLIQARNALQAAYTEVQRLLLLRQQCTTEVNSLRAKRIEILQGLQGGYSGDSNAAQKATASSAGSAAAVQPRLSPLPSSSAFPSSSSQQPLPSNPASSISQPPPTQPVALFPSDLDPVLLLVPPQLAAPTATVTSLKQLTSANTAPEVARETVRLERGEEAADGHSGEGGRNHVKEPASEKPVSSFVPERNQNAAASDDDGGNKSDDSVKLMEPSDPVVINIDESDDEATVSNVPVRQEPPQTSVSVEFSSAGVKTFQKNDAKRNVQPAHKTVQDATLESIEVLNDEELYLGAFENHKGPVHGLQIHEGRLYTCSGDNTARAYSLVSRECQAVFEGHTHKINCLLVSSLPNAPARLYTGSSDETVRCYSLKTQKCLEEISLSDRVLCLHVAWNILFSGLANGSVASHDLKTLKQLDVFECHGPRGISCLGTAQEGARRVLLVGSYDSTISVRDAKSGLLLRTLKGHTKTVLCMKVVNDLVFSGSSDTSVHAHNIHTGELVRIYKGHGHAVTSIVILGKVMVTACLDKMIRVYELQSHDRLQVYGGHSDMVMCMAIHQSVIYTGCYDGSVQAVKLNLLKNYRCWWQNCSLIFGIAEHLVQHLVGNHTNRNMQMVKCRWRSCSSFFATQQSIWQELPEHMRSHVDEDSEVQP